MKKKLFRLLLLGVVILIAACTKETSETGKTSLPFIF